MDLETKAQLDKILAISEENHKMLVKVRNFQRWSSISKALYWLVIVGISFGAFYFIKPYLAQITNLYQSGSDNIDALKSLGNNPDINQIKDLLQSLQNKK